MTTERPILFSGAMCQAILDGSKTQTRRVIKTSAPQVRPQFNFGPSLREEALRKCKPRCRNGYEFMGAPPNIEINLRHPYGLIGSRIWVLETFAVHKSYDSLKVRSAYEAMAGDVAGCIAYKAAPDTKNWRGKWRPSIFMPRWASRITLEITDVRVERVQEISEDDSVAEGIAWDGQWYLGGVHPIKGTPQCWSSAKRAYRARWDSINAKRGYGWETNPFVWVISFRRIKP